MGIIYRNRSDGSNGSSVGERQASNHMSLKPLTLSNKQYLESLGYKVIYPYKGIKITKPISFTPY